MIWDYCIYYWNPYFHRVKTDSMTPETLAVWDFFVVEKNWITTCDTLLAEDALIFASLWILLKHLLHLKPRQRYFDIAKKICLEYDFWNNLELLIQVRFEYLQLLVKIIWVDTSNRVESFAHWMQTWRWWLPSPNKLHQLYILENL